MVAIWLLWVKSLRLDYELHVDAGWRILDLFVCGNQLLIQGTDAHRHVGTDGGGFLDRFMARQLLLHMFTNIDEEERQREPILENPELFV